MSIAATLNDIANRLTHAAIDAERLAPPPMADIPEQNMSLREAAEEVIRACPGQPISINIEYWPLHKNAPISFGVWDGEQHHKSTNLRRAVNACIAWNEAKRAVLCSPIEAVDIAQEALGEPVPAF